ncbi:hypothetical protein GCK32_021429, partial [Trichostrongylus colubriformis]
TQPPPNGGPGDQRRLQGVRPGVPPHKRPVPPHPGGGPPPKRPDQSGPVVPLWRNCLTLKRE